MNKLFLFCLFILLSSSNLLSQIIPQTKSVEELSDKEKYFHLFSRLSFGPTQYDSFQFSKSIHKNQTFEAFFKQWLNQQMTPTSLDDIQLDLELKKIKSLSMTNKERLAKYKKDKNGQSSFLSSLTKDEDILGTPKELIVELVNQKMLRASQSQKQLQEVLVDFWFNHFNVDVSKNLVKYYVASYEEEAIRKHVFTSFPQMLKAVAQDPAMLFYLDAYLSVKEGMTFKGKKNNGKVRGLNENYARELLELHTLGVDGGYTQNDIKELARALTGFTIKKPKEIGEFVFQEKAHDNGVKLILGQKLAGKDGYTEALNFLDFLALHPKTASYISQKLVQKFVSDSPQPELVKKLAETYLKNKGDFKSLYLTLFSSKEFWQREHFQQKVKTPFEFAISALRATDSELIIFKKPKNPLTIALEKMGQPIYRCQPPTGFKQTADFWVNPTGLVNRIQLGLMLSTAKINVVKQKEDDFLQKIKKQISIEEALNFSSDAMLMKPLSPVMYSQILKEVKNDNLLIDENKINRNNKEAIPAERIVGLILGSPDFQKR